MITYTGIYLTRLQWVHVCWVYEGFLIPFVLPGEYRLPSLFTESHSNVITVGRIFSMAPKTCCVDDELRRE